MKSPVNNQTGRLGKPSPGCERIQTSLSEYVDNALSAHQMWEVEKHLTLCQDCNEAARQMQATVDILHTVEHFDTSDDFMAKLHARLDGVEPEPMRRRSLVGWTQDLVEKIRIDLAARRIPVLNFGIATAAMGVCVVVALVGRPISTNIIVPVPPASIEVGHVVPDSDDLQRNLALTASDPLGDVAAENLRITDNGSAGSSSSHIPSGTDGG